MMIKMFGDQNSHRTATELVLKLPSIEADNPPKQFDGCLVAILARISIFCRWDMGDD
jgi:hypothetical protein